MVALIIRTMPTLIRFSAARIAFYRNDHQPPHFHILGIGFELQVQIGTWAVILRKGRVPAAAAEALAWARANEPALRAEWERMHQ